MRKHLVISFLVLASTLADARPRKPPKPPVPPTTPPINIEYNCAVGPTATIKGMAVLSCSETDGELLLLSPKIGEIEEPVLDDGRYVHKFLYWSRKTRDLNTQVCGEGLIGINARHYGDGYLSGQHLEPDRSDCVKVYWEPFSGVYELLVFTLAPDTRFTINTNLAPPPPPPPPVLPPTLPPLPPPPPHL